MLLRLLTVGGSCECFEVFATSGRCVGGLRSRTLSNYYIRLLSYLFSQIWLRLNIPFPVVEIAVRRELYTFLVPSTYHSGLCAHVRDRERSRRRPLCVSTSGLLCYPCCSLCSVWGLAFRGP